MQFEWDEKERIEYYRNYDLRWNQNLPPMSKKELKALDDANIVYDEDCPELTDEQLRQFKPRYVNHPVSVHEKRKDGKICIPIDSDILKALKSPQKDYEKRINTILRRVVLGW